MRDIKFRGIRIDTNPIYKSKWAYGYLIIDDSGEVNIVKNYGDDAYSWDAVVPESVGQYTGLKDRNEKEIYKGDIARNKLGSIGVIEYHSSWAAFYFKLAIGKNEDGDIVKMTSSIPMWREWATLEVIGNIYENPELLEVSK